MSSQLKTQGAMGRMEDRFSIRSASTWDQRMKTSRMHRRQHRGRATKSKATNSGNKGGRPGIPAQRNIGGHAAVLMTKMKMIRKVVAGAPSPRSLFQRICWPADKGRSREHSPRCERDETSRQGGHRHNRDKLLSPATRRSWERSLDRRLLHRFQQQDRKKQPEAKSKKLPEPACK
jgi:hypothetical protein